MSAIERQGPHSVTIAISSTWGGELRKGEVVRVFGTDFGYVITPVTRGGESVAIQLDGFLTGIPMIRDTDGDPIVTQAGLPPMVRLESIREGILDRVNMASLSAPVQLTGRILNVQDGVAFSWNPKMGAASAAAGGVTQEDLNSSYAQLYAAIMGGSVPENLNSFHEILGKFDDIDALLAAKQNHSGTLDELALIDPSALGKQLLEASNAETVRDLIGVGTGDGGGITQDDLDALEGALEVVIADGDAATLASANASRVAGDTAALATIRGGVAGEFDTLAKLAASLAAKQDHSANLDALAASTSPSALGLAMLSAADATAFRVGINAQVAGDYASTADVAASAAQVKDELLNGAGTAYDTFRELEDKLEDADSAVAGIVTSLTNKQDKSQFLTDYAAYGATLVSNDPPLPGGELTHRKLITYAPDGDINSEDFDGAAKTPKFFSIDLSDDLALSIHNAGPSDFRVNIGAASQDDLDAATASIAARQPGSTWLTQYNTAGVALQADFTGGDRTIDPDANLQGYVFVMPAPGDARFTPFATYVGQFGADLLAIDGANAFDQNKLFYVNSGGQLTRMAFTTFGRNVLTTAPTVAGQIPYATNGAGALGYVTSGVGGRNLLGLATPASGAMAYFSDAAGAVGTVTTTALGRSFLTQAATANVGYYNNGAGALTQTALGTFGRGLWALGTPVTGSVPYATDAAGTVGTITSTTLGRSFMGVATAQAARSLTARRASTFYTNGNTALVANEDTEVAFQAVESTLGFDLASVQLTGVRINATSNSLAVCSVSGAVVVDAPCDLVISWILTNAAGVEYVPTAGDGISRPASAQVPGFQLIRCHKAGRFPFVGPAYVPLSTTGSTAQLRIKVTAAQDVNLTSFAARLDQHALEAIT